MTWQKWFGFLMVAQLCLFSAIALAEDNNSQVNGANDSFWSNISALPKTVSGVVYGVTLGVPIRITIYTISESQRMTQTMLDDFDGPGFWNMAMARSIGIPYGIASGTMLGLIRGVQYGGQYGAQEPFSKKSIGWGQPCLVGQN